MSAKAGFSGRRGNARRSARLLLGGLHADFGGDHRDAVFLAGTGRSGTTWLSEVLNHRNEYRYVFEPFRPDRVRACSHFRSKQYLRPDDRREEYLGPAGKVLSGEVRGLWVDRYNRKFVARRRLIKDIRANLLLGWLHANFPEMPLILLLRHPCAVAASRLKLGWRDNLDETMQQEELVEDFLLPMEFEIRAARGDFERHLFLWCIDNYVPLRQLAPGAAHLVFYENLLTGPENELRSLFAFLNKDFGENIYRGMSRPPAVHRTIDGWRAFVSQAQLRRAMEILRMFGMDGIYNESSMPEPDSAHALMRSRIEGQEEASGWTSRR